MHVTYLNDYNLLQFPFDYSINIPFPSGIFKCINLAVSGSTDNKAAYVSAVELGEDTVTASICYDYKYLCSITANYNGYCSSYGDVDGIHYNVIMACGDKIASAVGTYKGTFTLCRDCVIGFSDVYTYGGYSKIYVNGNGYTIGERLNIVFSGYFSADVSSEPYAIVTARVPEDAKTLNITTSYAYTMLDSINDVTVDGADNTDEKLVIEIAAPETAKAGTDPSTYITCELLNAVTDVYKNKYSTDPDISAASGARTTQWCNLNDKCGDAVILTINGLSKIPHCYGDDDESEETPEGN